jgi:hypothetical protein
MDLSGHFHAPILLSLEKDPDTRWMEDWVGLRVGAGGGGVWMFGEEKNLSTLPGFEPCNVQSVT